MRIKADITSKSKANRLRRIEKAETKANPFKIAFFSYSERMIHFRINGKGKVIETFYYPFNN
jgi:hypothetical protein